MSSSCTPGLAQVTVSVDNLGNLKAQSPSFNGPGPYNSVIQIAGSAVNAGTNSITGGAISGSSMSSSGSVTVGGNGVLTTGGAASLSLPATSGTLALTSQIPSSNFAIYQTIGSTFAVTTQQGGWSNTTNTIIFPTSVSAGIYIVSISVTGSVPTLSSGGISLTIAGGVSTFGPNTASVFNASAATQTLTASSTFQVSQSSSSATMTAAVTGSITSFVALIYLTRIL